MTERASGTVTFLFTDIEGSTRLWDRHPDLMRDALARHDEIVWSAIGAHGGHVFSTGGDGFGVAFRRSVDAVGAALDGQRALQREAWPQDADIYVRMGIDTGEAQERDGNYYGPPLNRAARLMGAAHGGQIVVSRATVEVLGRVLGIQLIDLGSHRLKGLADAVQIFGVATDDFAWLDRPLATADETRGNMPRAATEFVGHGAEVRNLADELATRRLVTLTGSGGVGKTRLATEVAWFVIDQFPAGVWMVDLAAVGEPASVPAAVMSTLSIQTQPAMTVIDSIVDWLRGRRLLLVMDNCEHVLDAAAELCQAVAAGCPTVTVLATSREPLHIQGERVHTVASLDPASDAMDLFIDRATSADGSFTATAADRGIISTICRRLDGMPLAIELAAARTRSLAPTDLLTHLDDRFGLLHAASGRRAERHRTLRATVMWSYELMTDGEQVLFDRLSVFRGGFTLEAAESVCSDDLIDVWEVASVLSSLVEKSMAVTHRDEHGVRYRLLEVLRQFGEERLEQRSDSPRMRDRHLAHYVAVARQAHRQWPSPRQLEADAMLDRDWDNLRGAHAWALVGARNVEIAGELLAATGPHALCRMIHEHGDWATRMLELGHRSHPDTYGWAAFWAFTAGDHDGAVRLAQRGIDTAASPDHPDTAWCWCNQVWAHLAAGRGDEARQPAEQVERASIDHPDLFTQSEAHVARIEYAFALDLPAVPDRVSRYVHWARALGGPSLLASLAPYDGFARLLAGPPAAGHDPVASALDGLELARAAGDVLNEGKNLVYVVTVAARFRTEDATEICRDALVRLYDTRHWSQVWPALEPIARWMTVAGKVEGAAVLYGHLEAHHPPWDRPPTRRARQAGLRALDELPHAAQLMSRGAVMDRDELMVFVIDQLATSSTA